MSDPALPSHNDGFPQKVPALEFESRLRVFLDNSPAVAWMKDAEGRHVYVSDPYLEKIGVPGDAWLGKTDFDLWPADIAQRFVEVDRQVLESGKPVRFEDREDFTWSGETRVWWVVKFPFDDSKGQKYVGGIAVDISDQKRAEEERRLLEREIAKITAREQLRIGLELHDGVGQELAALSLFAGSLKGQLEQAGDDGHINHDFLAQVLGTLDRIETGIRVTNRHIRQYSQGVPSTRIEQTGLGEQLQGLAKKTDACDGVRCQLHCDSLLARSLRFPDVQTAIHLFRIAQEATNNALKHSGADLVLIELREDGEQLVLEVHDNGDGMQQTSRPNAVGLPRSGMGLRIMNYRAELIAGKLEFGANHPRGTSVRCVLPKPVKYVIRTG
ncbi:MAG: PAS domain-containing protein [Pirellulaceae bacterium]